MTITTNALFVLACIGLGIWFKKDPGFKKREFLAVSAFWLLALATPWGDQVATTVQGFFGTATQSVSSTVNNVSSR